MNTQRNTDRDSMATGSDFEPNLPDGFGYFWVTKNQGEKPVLLHLCPGKEFRRDQRSVEAWECPGIGRSRLDWLGMPRWQWERIPEPSSLPSHLNKTTTNENKL